MTDGSAGTSAGGVTPPPQEKLGPDPTTTRKIGPLGGAVARVFPNVSLAMCPLKLSLPPPPVARLWRQY